MKPKTEMKYETTKKILVSGYLYFILGIIIALLILGMINALLYGNPIITYGKLYNGISNNDLNGINFNNAFIENKNW